MEFLEEAKLGEALKQAKAIVVPFEEFNECAGEPVSFPWDCTPLFVTFQDYYQCDSWLADAAREDLFLSDLYPEEVKNFYTVLFFRRRQIPNVIYVFPTLKYLGEKLLKKWDLKHKILFSENQESLKIFSCFSDEIQMLQSIQWLMAFLSGTEWDGGCMEQAASALSAGFVKSLFNSALAVKRKDYWRYKSCLPTPDTKSDGFYVFMEFDGRENMGNICAQEYRGKNYPIFFADRNTASLYEKQLRGNKNWKLTAVDSCYWDMLSEYLRQGDGKWYLYVSEGVGILLDVDVYNQALEFIRQKKDKHDN